MVFPLRSSSSSFLSLVLISLYHFLSMASLTDYEKTRLENIRRNQEKLASLNLNVNELRLSLQKRKEIKGYKVSPSKKPKKENAPVVIRRSLRARGIPPDAVLSKGIDDDLPTPDRHQSSFPSSPSSPPPYKRQTPFSTKEVYEGKSDQGEFKKSVIGMCENTPLDRIRGRRKPRDLEDCSFKLEKMRLKEENIARIVSGRILSVRFFPTDQRTVVVAGDKYGHVGFWDVDYGEEKEGGDGVYIYCPHSAPVSGITVQPFALSKVFTSAYDGFIRMMDIEEETFYMVYSTSEAIFSLGQCPNDNNLYFGEGSGELKIWDDKSGKISNSCHLHESRINSIDFHPNNTNLMLTSSSDGTACIWDLRNIKQSRSRCITTVHHKRAIHSAYFSPTGSLLATTSFDNQLGLLRGTDAQELKFVHHNNQTSRWISTFRAIWGWDDSYLFIGNTKRAVDAISTSSRTTTTLESSLMTAIPCRFAAHPCLRGSLAGATGGGQVYLWTTD